MEEILVLDEALHATDRDGCPPRQDHRTTASKYLERIAQSLRDQGVGVETAISHSTSPSKEIVRYAREVKPDLVIMGAHGHGG